MSRGRRVLRAMALGAPAVVLAASATVLTVLNGYPAAQLVNEAVGPLATVSFAAVGAILASYLPRNAVGWIFLFTGITQGLVSSSYVYAEYALVTAPGSLPFGPLASWVGQLAWYPGLFAMLTYGLLLFPDGRLPGRGWRVVAWGCAAPLVLFAVAAASTWSERGKAFLYEDAAQPGVLVFFVEALLFPLLLLCALLCIASLVVRYRGSGPAQRQQLKWFVYAAAATVLAIALLENTASFFGEGVVQEAVGGLLLLLVVPTIPAAVGISILRYRLYDIDLLINRTLVYALLTAALVAVYLAGVISSQYLFRILTGDESQLAVVASTLAIAALFSPLRRRVQGFVDRRFYRGRYDASRALAAFGARLRAETDLAALRRDLVGVVRETVRPEHVSLWLREPGQEPRRASG